MRYALSAALLLFTAAPALATGGWSCRTTAPEGVRLDIVTGGGGIALATLGDGRRTLSTERELRIGQSWIDEHSLLLDLTDTEATERVARLRVTVRGELGRRNPAGTLECRPNLPDRLRTGALSPGAQIACLRASTRSVFSQVKKSLAGLRPKWP